MMVEILGPYTSSTYFVKVGEGERLPEAVVEAVESVAAWAVESVVGLVQTLHQVLTAFLFVAVLA